MKQNGGGRTRTGDHPTLMIVEYNAIITTEGSRLPSLTQLGQAFERRRDGAAPPVRQNERPSTLLPAAACKMFNPFGRDPSFPLSLPHNISTSEEPTAAAVQPLIYSYCPQRTTAVPWQATPG